MVLLDMSLVEAETRPVEVDAAPPQVGLTFKRVLPGDPFPSLAQSCGARERFAFDSLAGRYQLFCFFASAEDSDTQAVLRTVMRRRHLFDDQHCSFTGVSVSPGDRDVLKLQNQEPGLRFAWDFNREMSKLCGAAPLNLPEGQPPLFRRQWVLVDPSLHVLALFPLSAATVDQVLDHVARLPAPDRFGGVARPAPILLLPNVFDRGLCGRLIEAYKKHGGGESGVHRNGQGVYDFSFKRRKDFEVSDCDLLQEANTMIGRRVAPQIEKLFFMRPNYIERHIVGCYAAEDGGHFSAHRDNGQGATAHRRFAVSINLNDDFGGGEVVFPEYSMQGYKAPAGWAVVFPCAALHQVLRVTHGARYAFLPFVYDEEGRRIRDEHLSQVKSLIEPAG